MKIEYKVTDYILKHSNLDKIKGFLILPQDSSVKDFICYIEIQKNLPLFIIINNKKSGIHEKLKENDKVILVSPVSGG